jgi:hypothetical protein
MLACARCREQVVDREHRRHPRAPFGGWVEVMVQGRRRLGTGCDLSAGGIGLALRGDALAPGGVVTSEFALPGISLPLALDGRIVWTDVGNQRLGIAFERVDPGLAELLESFVGGRL